METAALMTVVVCLVAWRYRPRPLPRPLGTHRYLTLISPLELESSSKSVLSILLSILVQVSVVNYSVY